MVTFKKFDEDKLRFDLIDPNFLEEIAYILTMGGLKYGFENFKKLPKEEIYRYKAALLRHINQYLQGSIIDEESEKSHLAHAACNLMFLYYFTNKDNDNNE